jgi:hypothetical protein
LSRPFSIVPIRLSAPYYDPAVHTHTAEGTNLQSLSSVSIVYYNPDRNRTNGWFYKRITLLGQYTGQTNGTGNQAIGYVTPD